MTPSADGRARAIAGVVGPVLLVLGPTEAMNAEIWREVAPTLVYLNGLLLLICGAVILRLHPILCRRWPVLVTLTGAFLCVGGITRMIWPAAPQIEEGPVFVGMTAAVGLLGAVLCWQAFRRPPG